MARKTRTTARRVFRLTLDPLDPLEGMALQRMDEIGAELRQRLTVDPTPEEVERYALKRLILEALAPRQASPAPPAEAFPRAEAPRRTLEDAPQAGPSSVAQERAPESQVADSPTTADPINTPTETSENPGKRLSQPGSWQEELVKEPPSAPAVSPLLRNLSWDDHEET